MTVFIHTGTADYSNVLKRRRAYGSIDPEILASCSIERGSSTLYKLRIQTATVAAEDSSNRIS
jgi:hypothetical protein